MLIYKTSEEKEHPGFIVINDMEGIGYANFDFSILNAFSGLQVSLLTSPYLSSPLLTPPHLSSLLLSSPHLFSPCYLEMHAGFARKDINFQSSIYLPDVVERSVPLSVRGRFEIGMGEREERRWERRERRWERGERGQRGVRERTKE